MENIHKLYSIQLFINLAGNKFTAILANNAFCAECSNEAVSNIAAALASLFEDGLANPVRMDNHANMAPCAFFITNLGPVLTI